jgi:hypothetical protein
VLGLLRVRDQLVNGLLGEKLAGQKASFNKEIGGSTIIQLGNLPGFTYRRDVAVLRLYVRASRAL